MIVLPHVVADCQRKGGSEDGETPRAVTFSREVQLIFFNITTDIEYILSSASSLSSGREWEAPPSASAAYAHPFFNQLQVRLRVRPVQRHVASSASSDREWNLLFSCKGHRDLCTSLMRRCESKPTFRQKTSSSATGSHDPRFLPILNRDMHFLL
jgi:hypothetical protein